MSKEKVGIITKDVISCLNLSCSEGTGIYIGKTNKEHIKRKHPYAYQKYFNDIGKIISHPDYVCISPKDGSIEYVKQYKIENEYVKVAVRATNNSVYFIRSLYILNNNRVDNFINKGTLKTP